MRNASPCNGAWEYFEEQLPGVGSFFTLRMSTYVHSRLKIFLTLLLFATATHAHATEQRNRKKSPPTAFAVS